MATTTLPPGSLQRMVRPFYEEEVHKHRIIQDKAQVTQVRRGQSTSANPKGIGYDLPVGAATELVSNPWSGDGGELLAKSRREATRANLRLPNSSNQR